MKKTYAFALTAGLLLLGSCAANEPEVNTGNGVDTDGAGFINFAFTHSAGTRDGEGAEVEAVDIKTADFLFYASDGRYLGVQSVVADQDNANAKWISTPSHTVAEDVPVDLCVALKVPFAEAYSVTVVLNKGAVSITSNQNQIATNAVTGTNYREIADSKEYWVMSNAVTYGSGHNINDPKTNVETWRVTLDKRYVYEDLSKAAAAEAKAAATVNVERTVAKMEITASSSCFSKKEDGTTLYATIGSSNFGATGEAAGTTYEIEFMPTNAYATNTPNQGALIKQLPDYTNLDTKEKSFVYPDRTSLCAIHNKATLNNWSLSTLNNQGAELFTNNVRYLYDNDGETGDERSATAVAVVGKYNVYKTVDGTKTLIAGADHETVKDFYLMGVGDVWRVFTDEAALLTAMGATKETTKLKKQMNSKNEWTGYMELDGEDTPYVCMMYKGGNGYYTRYIELAKDGNKVYSYVTRNHKYNVEINKIEGMGIGLPDNTTEIVPINPPKPNEKSFYMHISVNVVDWIPVAKQTVNW